MVQVDHDLIRRCLKKDRKAQSELFEACFGFLMPVCMRYAACEDDGHAYLNLGFYKILRNLKKYRESVPFEAWCKRVLINTIIDELRRNKRYRQQVQLGEVLPVQEKTEIFWEDQAITVDDIYQCIQGLPPMTAAVFNLFALDGYQHKEIAKMLKMSEGTSKWHYAEARKRLKVQLASLTKKSLVQ